MPVKTKNKSTKKIKPIATDKADDMVPVKPRKIDEVDEVDAFIAPEEKQSDDLSADTEEDEFGEEISLDNEEIDPFGDKWEK